MKVNRCNSNLAKRRKLKYSTELLKDDSDGNIPEFGKRSNVCPYSTKCSTTSKSRIDSIKLDIREKTKELKKRRDTCSNERSFSGYNRSNKENINTSNIRECNIINSKSRNNEETVKAIIQKYRVDSKALKEANSRSKQFYSFIEKSNNGHLYKEHNKFGQVPFQTSENMSKGDLSKNAIQNVTDEKFIKVIDHLK